MRYLSIIEVLEIHDELISTPGGSHGIRDLKALESAVSQPRLTFDKKELYPDKFVRVPFSATTLADFEILAGSMSISSF